MAFLIKLPFTIAKNVIKLTIVTGGLAGAFLYATKPTKESFDDFLKEQLGDNNKSILSNVTNKVTTGLTLSASKIVHKDYLFVRVAEVSFPLEENKCYYVGVVQNWVPLTQSKNQ